MKRACCRHQPKPTGEPEYDSQLLDRHLRYGLTASRWAILSVASGVLITSPAQESTARDNLTQAMFLGDASAAEVLNRLDRLELEWVWAHSG